MLELVQEFAAELPARARELESRLDQRAFEDLQRLAHQLKGAGGGYGFPQITEVAATLEQSLKEGAAEGVVKERTALLCDTLRAVTVSGGS
jgi:HPt (histidine-containing phosphotransfer) domain-containing protein